MELRHFADRVLQSADLAVKLQPPRTITDGDPGPATRIEVLARPAELQFWRWRRGAKMPGDLQAIYHRAVAHHLMANHELQALEAMAFVLRAFPSAPTEFRLGLARIMLDEQRHTKMHLRRMTQLGLSFGARKVNGHVWRQVKKYHSLLDYLASIPLTFENANLDHTLNFADRFAAVGDEVGAKILRRVHADEIEHVAFGLTWLRQLKPTEQSDWETYIKHLPAPLRPDHAQGDPSYDQPRLQAGMEPAFIRSLRQQWQK